MTPRRTRRVLTGSFLVLGSLISSAAFAQQPAAAGATVTLVVTGHEAKGALAAALFAAAEGFPQKTDGAAQRLVVPATAGADTIVFRNVPAGRYAIAVYRDANGNTKLDTNMFGVPREQWGVSNNVRPSMRSPRYEEAAFEVRGATTIAVTAR